MVEELVADTERKVVHYPACLPVCRIKRYIISFVDITLVTMPEQVLVHLVQSRCVVASVELLRQEQARHSSVDSFSSVIHPRLGFVCFELLSAAEVLNHRVLVSCKELHAEATQTTEYRTEGLLESLERETKYVGETERADT